MTFVGFKGPADKVCRGAGGCRIFGVLMTFWCGIFLFDLEILGVLNSNIPPISSNIGGAIALPAPPVPPPLEK